MTNGKRRRLSLLILALCLIVIASVLVQIWFSLASARQTVGFAGIEIIAPIESKLCPGDTLRFPVVADVPSGNLPDQIELAESWCKVGPTGACWGVQPAALKDGAKRLPLVKPKHIISPSTPRIVPTWLTPGEYEFWHTAMDKDGTVVGYSVEPITIKDCTP